MVICHVPSRPRAASRGEGSADTARITRVLEPVVRSAGVDLESVKVAAAGRRRVLRIVVDADGGVSLDDIALVSRELSAALDDSVVMGDQPYTLEVSSPGVDRPLTERRHWRRAIGRLVVAPLLAPGDAGHGSPSRAGSRARALTGSRWTPAARAASLATATSARAR